VICRIVDVVVFHCENVAVEAQSCCIMASTFFFPAVREGFYGDMLGLYTRTGIVSDETIANVVRFTQATRKTQENISVSDITDWTFAKKANEEMKR
jgi:hypothetical protein